MIRLFASDMDGTLLNEQHIISHENANAIKQLQQQGIEFMIATGRDYHSATQLLNAQNIHCALVTLNGACIYTAEGTLIYQQAINTTACEALIDFLTLRNIHFVFQSQDNFYVSDMERFIASAEAFTTQHSDDIHDLTAAQMKAYISAAQPMDHFSNPVNEPILKFMVSSDCPADLTEVRMFFANNAHLDITSSADNNLEITSNFAQKGLALEYYAKHIGLSMSEIAGIGDSLNDRSMLKMVGYSFAMANANDTIKQIAKYPAPTHTEHGVAQIIHQIIAGKFN